jgi:hypothetical protein
MNADRFFGEGEYLSLEQLAAAVGRTPGGLRSGRGQAWRRRHGLIPVQPWPPALYDARRTWFKAEDVRRVLAGDQDDRVQDPNAKN